MNGFSECAFITGKNGMATVERVAIATQFVSATDGIDCSIFSVCRILIVALFFPFLIEVCGLLCCVVYSQCKITHGEAGQPKMYFCDGRNFRAKFRPSHF